jgi:hypothetical protein
MREALLGSCGLLSDSQESAVTIGDGLDLGLLELPTRTTGGRPAC